MRILMQKITTAAFCGNFRSAFAKKSLISFACNRSSLWERIFYSFAKKYVKNMLNLYEEKKEFALGNRTLVFWQGKKAESVVGFFYL